MAITWIFIVECCHWTISMGVWKIWDSEVIWHAICEGLKLIKNKVLRTSNLEVYEVWYASNDCNLRGLVPKIFSIVPLPKDNLQYKCLSFEVVTWCIYEDCVWSCDLVYIRRLCLKLWLGVYTKIVCEVVTWRIYEDCVWNCDLVYMRRLCVKRWAENESGCHYIKVG